MDELQNLRNQIDDIDEAVIKLLSGRLAVVQKIAEYKNKHGLDIYQQTREAEIFKKISAGSEQSGQREYILQIYAEILRASRAAQKI